MKTGSPKNNRKKIAHLHGAFLGFFELEASPEEGQSLQRKNKKRRKRKGKKKIKQEDLLDLITTFLKFNCSLITTVAAQYRLQSSS